MSRRAARGRDTASSYERIWSVVRRIPRGRVATYGQVAALSGLPDHARLAGYALHASTDHTLPWHRVVNAAGALSLSRVSPSGGITQRLRLEREGVRFDARGRVVLAAHRWERGVAKRGSRTGRSPRAARRRPARSISSEA